MRLHRDIHQARILVVDDNIVNLKVLGAILNKDGYSTVTCTQDPSQVLALYNKFRFDLIILDIHMPVLTGFDVMAQLSMHFPEDLLPIIILTADEDESVRDLALAGGARDFIRKPFKSREALLRAKNLIETVYLHKELAEQNAVLDHRVQERTAQLNHSQIKLIECLGRAAEFKDNETGMHVIRISKTTAIIAKALNLPSKQVELISNASPMHDVGKIGIPDRVLLKPGKLDTQEWEIMQNHAKLGANILQGGSNDSELLNIAAEIALTHHERWDGSGYPKGLKGEEIPLHTRITSVCDVFDALTSRRPYKEPWSTEDAMTLLFDQKEKAFDPKIVDYFKMELPAILKIREHYPDPPEERATSLMNSTEHTHNGAA